MDDKGYGTSGLMMIAAPPPSRKSCLIIGARLTGDLNDARKAFNSLYDLTPVVVNGEEVPVQNVSDGRAAFEAKGNLRHFTIAGLPGFKMASYLKLIPLYQKMVE